MPGRASSGKIHSISGWTYCPAVSPLVVSMIRYSRVYLTEVSDSLRKTHWLRGLPVLYVAAPTLRSVSVPVQWSISIA